MLADLSIVGKALGARARAAMVLHLLDGGSHSAGELANVAGVASGTASGHLAVLTESGLVSVTKEGRHRRYRIGDPGIAAAIEALAGPDDLPRVTSLRMSREQRRIRDARTCYDHLAGRLGVALMDTMLARDWLSQTVDQVTPTGEAALAEIGIKIDELARSRRPLLRTCVDWTERRPHLAGSLGAALASSALNLGWVRRRDGSRGLDLTECGRDEFAALGVAL